MAQRRMFNVKLLDSAKFLKMPLSTQALYFHLGLRADDDGIVEAFNVMRLTNSAEDDLKILAAKGLVNILNEDLVTYISDWNEHNYIRADRKIDSIYKDLLVQLVDDDSQMTAECLPNDNQMATNVPHRLGKVRLGKDSIERYICIPDVKKVKLTDEQYNKLINEYGKEYVDSKILDMDSYVINNPRKAYKDYYRALGTWIRKEQGKKKNPANEEENQFLDL